jgi:hypothetical protein
MHLFVRKPSAYNLLLIAILLLSLLTDAKAQSYHSGTIIDAHTKEPISGATVYINNSQYATISNGNGQFQFPFSAGHSVTLVVTHIGYQKASSTYNNDSPSPIIMLSQKANTLNEVVVKGQIKDTWKKWGDLFEENFLGNSTPKKAIYISNYKAIRFRYLPKEDKLIVTSKEPLEIINRWLGYSIKYDLDSFIYSFSNNYVRYTGTSFYTPLKGDTTQEAQWNKHRVVAYMGSQMHFLRSLYVDSTTMAQQGFKLFIFHARKNPERERVDEVIFQMQKNNYLQGKNTTSSIVLTGNKDTIAYYNEILKKPLYIFYDSLPLLLSKRLTIEKHTRHLSIQKDTLLVSFDPRLAYQHYFGIKVYEKLVEEKLLTKTKQPFAILAPWVKPKDEYSLFIATRNDSITIHENGYSDPAGLFVLGVMADKKVGGSLPWDYLPATQIK